MTVQDSIIKMGTDVSSLKTEIKKMIELLNKLNQTQISSRNGELKELITNLNAVNKRQGFILDGITKFNNTLNDISNNKSSILETNSLMNDKLSELVAINKILAKYNITGEIAENELDYINNIDI